MPSRKSPTMRTVDVARRAGCSVQQVRNLERDPARGSRRYTPAQVRDARIVHQLRRAGYRIAPLQALMPQFRGARRSEDVGSALAARDADITARSRALLDGAAALGAVLSLSGRDVRPPGRS